MGSCEALIEIEDRWVRCWQQPLETHHLITRGRGGKVLDKAGETYHLMKLCHEHHMQAHDQAQAFERGLLLPGSVVTGPYGKPVYTGPDEYLSKKYPRTVVREDEHD